MGSLSSRAMEISKGREFLQAAVASTIALSALHPISMVGQYVFARRNASSGKWMTSPLSMEFVISGSTMTYSSMGAQKTLSGLNLLLHCFEHEILHFGFCVGRILFAKRTVMSSVC